MTNYNEAKAIKLALPFHHEEHLKEPPNKLQVTSKLQKATERICALKKDQVKLLNDNIQLKDQLSNHATTLSHHMELNYNFEKLQVQNDLLNSKLLDLQFFKDENDELKAELCTMSRTHTQRESDLRETGLSILSRMEQQMKEITNLKAENKQLKLELWAYKDLAQQLEDHQVPISRFYN